MAMVSLFKNRGFKDLPRYLAGLAAIGLSLYLLGKESALPILFASAFFLFICATDTFFSRIPNLANLALALAAFGYHFHITGLHGLLTAFLGMATGFSLLIIFYLLGGMGAGDVKALAALGALLGPAAIFQVFLYMGLIGGVMAVFHYAFNRNIVSKTLAGLQGLRTFLYTRDLDLLKPAGGGEPLRFPYAAAIAFGFFAHVRWGGLL